MKRSGWIIALLVVAVVALVPAAWPAREWIPCTPQSWPHWWRAVDSKAEISDVFGE